MVSTNRRIVQKSRLTLCRGFDNGANASGPKSGHPEGPCFRRCIREAVQYRDTRRRNRRRRCIPRSFGMHRCTVAVQCVKPGLSTPPSITVHGIGLILLPRVISKRLNFLRSYVRCFCIPSHSHFMNQHPKNLLCSSGTSRKLSMPAL